MKSQVLAKTKKSFLNLDGQSYGDLVSSNETSLYSFLFFYTSWSLLTHFIGWSKRKATDSSLVSRTIWCSISQACTFSWISMENKIRGFGIPDVNVGCNIVSFITWHDVLCKCGFFIQVLCWSKKGMVVPSRWSPTLLL